MNKVSTLAELDLKRRHEVTVDDIESVATLVRSTTFFSEGEVDLAIELAESRARLGERSEYHFLLYEHGHQLVAYTCFGVVPATDLRFDLYWIVVDPGWQAKGLGSAVLAETEVEVLALGGKRIYAETSGRVQYLPTRKFYEKNGYSVASVLSDYYADGDDKVTYLKATLSELSL